MSGSIENRSALIAIMVALAAVIFFADISVPLGVAGGVPYVALVLLGWWLEKTGYIFLLGAVSSVLTVAGYFLSPEGGIEWMVLTNRSLALFAIWVTAGLLAKAKRSEMAVRLAHEELELKVERRTTELRKSNAQLREEIADRERAEVELRESEERFRAVIDNAPASIVFKDLDGRYRIVNKRFHEWHGTPGQVFLGKTSHDIHPAAVAEAMAAQDRRVLKSLSIIEQEHEVPFADGAIHRLVITKFPVFDSVEAPIGICGTAVDVTNQRAVEAQLLHAQKMESVGQLTGGIAHDFNNLLAVMLGNLELLENEIVDSPKAREVTETVIAAAERGARLTQQLLAYSRKQVLRPRAFNLNATVQGMIDLLRRTLGETIELEVVSDAGLWQCVADPGQMENALLNLALNARDGMPTGGKLTIETANARLDDEYAAAQEEVTPGQYVLLAVSDTGVGMAPEVVEKAFEPFFTTKEAAGGSGLGLSMVYGYVKQSNGHIKIYSEPGEGTTVKMYMPRTGRTDRPEAEPPRTDEPRGRGEVVLVVEDDPGVRTLAVTLLGGMGYDVLDAPDGASALSLLAGASSVALLLTDVVLPGGMSGSELAREAARLVPGLKVLYMSGYTENAVVHQGRLDEGVKLLQKPFRKADLARRVRDALDQK